MTSIAIFDYFVVPTNPIGGCHRQMLAALSSDYDFTVFAVEFDNPSPERIKFQRVPVPRRPLALLFVAYHLMAPICYWLHRLGRRRPFDLVQTVESNLSFGSITYAQFCHRGYLKLQHGHADRRNMRQWFRWLNHRLHAALEPWTYQRADHIVVPSRGLAEELAREYPMARDKIRVFYNPIDTKRLRRPTNFDVASFRRGLGWTNSEMILVFVALGHFERKGLPVLLDALTRVRDPRLKLLVVGGQRGVVGTYQARVRRLGLKDRVLFTGNRSDVRPYLWSADAFVLPSHYETFSLVAAEAAATELPVIAPMLHGVGEWIRNGRNGLVIAPNPRSVAAALMRFLDLEHDAVQAMGAQARHDVERFSLDRYAPQWRNFYQVL